MHGFENILVAIDLSQGDRFVYHDLPPATVEAVDRGLWIAKRNDARITFCYSLDVSAAAERLLAEAPEGESTAVDQAREVLQHLVDRATQEGVDAQLVVRIGKSWMEIIRQTLRGGHDLVLAGTRHLSSTEGFFLGSTGIKLLRKCPCPVWITQPQADKQIKTILVAHCLREVGDIAMELASSLAESQGSQLHVLHSLQPHESETGIPRQDSGESLATQREQAAQHIQAQLDKHPWAVPPQVHIVTEPPDEALIQQLAASDIELLVMGTIARSGVAGLITGNTAERLLPQIRCSVLAVKPPGFQSPIHL